MTGLPLWVVCGGRQRLSAPDPPCRLQALVSFKVSSLLHDVVECVYTMEMVLADRFLHWAGGVRSAVALPSIYRGCQL